MWHGQFLLSPKMPPKRGADVRAMVSRHGDAAILGTVLERFGTTLIRGAGAGKRRRDRGGATAMRETLRALEAGAVDIISKPSLGVGDGLPAIMADICLRVRAAAQAHAEGRGALASPPRRQRRSGAFATRFRSLCAN